MSEPAEQVRTMMMLNGLQSSAEDVLTAYRNQIMQDTPQGPIQQTMMQQGQQGLNQATRPTMEQMMNPTQPIVDQAQLNLQAQQPQAMFQ